MTAGCALERGGGRILSRMLEVIVAVLLTLGASARLTRLVTIDEFPPIVGVKARLSRRYGPMHWTSDLLDCPWCFAPWVLIPVGLSALAWHQHLWWQVLTGWLGAAYVVGWVVSRDA